MTTQSRSKNALTTLSLVIASGFGLGYAPFAPGTFGTLLGVLLFYCSAQLNSFVKIVLLLVLSFVAVFTAQVAGKYYRSPDSQHIVIDEVVGYLWAVVATSYSWQTAVVHFVFFRFFDILKPWPASFFDRQMKNGWGVVLDDIAAGLYAGLASWCVFHFLPVSWEMKDVLMKVH